jgi:glycosyltransferase involved in cell wall biosynthesis
LNILITTPYFFPAVKGGGPVKSVLNLIQTLPEHQYYILCSARDSDGSLLSVPHNSWVVHTQNVKVFYHKGIFSVRLLSSLKRIKPEVIYFNSIFSISLVLMPFLVLNTNRKILATRGMLSAAALQKGKTIKKLWLRILQSVGFFRNIVIHATSEAEREDVLGVLPCNNNVLVISNIPDQLEFLPVQSKQPGSLRMCVIALIGSMKNHHLVLKSLAAVKGEVIYDIYGPVLNQAYWHYCQSLISDLPKNVTVNYCSVVEPAEVAACYGRYHIYIQPSASENFGHSIYEALSSGRPVITSTSTPWQNLEANGAGINVNIAEPDSLKNAIENFINMEESQLKVCSLHASAYAQKAIDRNAIKYQYSNLFIGSVQTPL